MKTVLIYFGSGALFGMGACFGVAISAFCVTSFRRDMIKDQKAHNDKVLKALTDKVDAINSIASVLENKR